MFLGIWLQQEGSLNLMHQETPLVEGRQGIDRALQHANLLHVVVQVEVLLDLFAARGQHFTKLSSLASDLAEDSLEDQDAPITAASCHADTLFGNSPGLSEQNSWIFPLHGIHRLWLLAGAWINLEKIAHDGQMHEP